MKCKELSTALVCYNDGTVNQTLVAHYEYGVNATGATILVSTRYTDSAGVPVDTSSGTVTAGACPIASPDIEWEKLCDENTTTGVITEFFRRSITTWDAAGVPTVTVTDWELDKVTSYTVAGTVIACNEDCDAASAQGVLTAWG